MKKSILLTCVLAWLLGGCASQKPVEMAFGNFIAYSAQSGGHSYDGPEKNSPFTSALLQHINDPDDIELILRKVRQKVDSATKGLQLPVTESSLVNGTLVLSELRSSNKRAHALMIGNSAYGSAPPLANTVNDAKAISIALKGLGFEVTEALNTKRSDFTFVLNEFVKSSARSDVVLLFYSGHGIQIKGQDFILSIDSDGLSEQKILSQGIPIKQIIESFSNKTKVFIFDTDRSDVFSSSNSRR